MPPRRRSACRLICACADGRTKARKPCRKAGGDQPCRQHPRSSKAEERAQPRMLEKGRLPGAARQGAQEIPVGVQAGQNLIVRWPSEALSASERPSPTSSRLRLGRPAWALILEKDHDVVLVDASELRARALVEEVAVEHGAAKHGDLALERRALAFELDEL